MCEQIAWDFWLLLLYCLVPSCPHGLILYKYASLFGHLIDITCFLLCVSMKYLCKRSNLPQNIVLIYSRIWEKKALLM